MGHENRDLSVFILTFLVTYAITFTVARMFCRFILPRMVCDLACCSLPL